MPEISRFLGIVITMHHDDHGPAHFHARYGGRKATFGIQPLQPLRGSLPPRVVGLVMEWAARHRLELLEDWDLAARRAPLRKIPPLESLESLVFPDVVTVEVLAGRRLRLTFDDGAVGEVDLDHHLRFEGVFEPLLDPVYFARVQVNPDSGTIEWPNGADIDPVVLRSWATGEPLPDWALPRDDDGR